MEQKKYPTVTPVVLGLYFFPMLLCYLFLPHPTEERTIFIVGVIALVLCSLILFLLLKKYENDVYEDARLQVVEYQPQTMSLQEKEEYSATIAALQNDLHTQEASIFSLKEEQERRHTAREEEFVQQKAALHEECERKTRAIEELQQALEKSCQFAVNKEEQIAGLKSEIANLQFELKTLVHMEQLPRVAQSAHKDVPRGTSTTTIGLLDDALHAALLLAESGQLKGSTSRLFDFSSEALAIENRRLFEALEKLATLPLFVFCKKEAKLLFACGPLLGWTVEELQRDFFPSLIAGGEEIKKIFKEIYPFETKRVVINLAGRNMDLVLGLCPLPPFSQCVLAVAGVTPSYTESSATLQKQFV